MIEYSVYMMKSPMKPDEGPKAYAKNQIREIWKLVLNFGHTPLYRHFCKRLHIEMLKNQLFINYWHIANPILSGRILKKSLQPLNILVKNLPRYSHAERPCILTVLMML